MERQGEVRISQCMIVKDEEENIRKALSWGKGIVWEQIVVDTGSRDRTVQIAESMGAGFIIIPGLMTFPRLRTMQSARPGESGLHFWTRMRHLFRETGKSFREF